MGNIIEGGVELSGLNSPDQVSNLILNSTLRDVVKLPSSPLVAFNAQDDLHSCCVRLVKHGIHSAPVYEAVPVNPSSSKEEDGHTEKRWVGMLDWHGFVHYVIQFIRSDELTSSLGTQCAADIAKHHPMAPIRVDASLSTLLSGFGSQGLRRRPVFSTDTGDIIGMVSQLDVITWLSRHHNELSPVLENITIEQVVHKEQTDPRFSKMRQVCNVMMDTLMLDVLRLLDQSKLNGISVVDHTGKLAANISVSDLKYTVEKNLDNLFTTVEHFLERVPRRPLVTCSPKASLMKVIDRLASARVHRLYVVNEDEEPMAVITLTDVINALNLLIGLEATPTSTTDTSAK